MSDFQDKEEIVGYVDTDSGGILIADMIWDLPEATQKRVAMDLDMSNVRIPVKAVLHEGKRRLFLELDEAVSTLQTQEVVEVVTDNEEEQ